MEKGESYTNFSGSGDPNTVIRPDWDTRKQESLPKTSPDSIVGAVYDTTESAGNAYYVLGGGVRDQTVTSYIQFYQTDELAYSAPPKLTNITVTNNSQTYLNYTLSISGGDINISSMVSADPGATSIFNISPVTIPIDGLRVNARASNACYGPCIKPQNTILFRGWTDFIIRQ
jgi:hypothetical protein